MLTINITISDSKCGSGGGDNGVVGMFVKVLM